MPVFTISALDLMDPIFVYEVPIDIITKSCTFVEMKKAILYFSFLCEETAMPKWVPIWISMRLCNKTGSWKR